MHYPGMLIYQERIRRNWSQQGLCKGICTVSYLSKIENGKTDPSDEILRLLLERLELSVSPALEEEARLLSENAWECLLTDHTQALHTCMEGHPEEVYRATRHGLDLLLLRQFTGPFQPLPSELEACMDQKQLALQRILQDRCEEAIILFPHAYCYYWAGMDAYKKGSYVTALEHLQTCYDLAARMGAAHLMLHSRASMGNCSCNQGHLEPMERHYQAARRLALALNEDAIIAAIDYNTASVQLEKGQYETAYQYFCSAGDESMMHLHKLAICCEKLGKTEEALAALEKADAMESESPPTDLARMMCRLVLYRLRHPDYLKEEEYGELLLSCFQRLKEEMPMGFASFHLPWVQEWYAAGRQYKKAFELLSDFLNI